MADFSKMRRKQTAWPGFFSSNAPVRTLPAVELDEDAEVYQRVKHLQHLRAIHEAMEETGPLDTERPGYNPHLTDLFGDSTINPGRFTDVFGNELGIGQTLDALLGKYGPGHTPGAHNEDPGDPRDPYGKAKNDSGIIDRVLDGAGELGADIGEAVVGPAGEAPPSSMPGDDLNYRGPLPQNPIIQQSGLTDLFRLRDSVVAIKETIPAFGAGADAMTRAFNGEIVSRLPGVRQQLKGVKAEKPRSDDEGKPLPTRRVLLEIRKFLATLQRWGDPSTDFRLERAALGPLTAEVVEALWYLRNGGNPATYDRLGNMERRRRLTGLAAREILHQIRINHPSINWGEQGPPAPPPGGRGMVEAATASGLVNLDDDDK